MTASSQPPAYIFSITYTALYIKRKLLTMKRMEENFLYFSTNPLNLTYGNVQVQQFGVTPGTPA